MTTACLLITCPDKPGIVASITGFLYSHGANITALDQHSTDPENGTFFMRLEFQTKGLDLDKETLKSELSRIAEKFNMDWKVSYANELKRMAVLVSKYDHTLLELLWRLKREEIKAELTMVVSNHKDLKKDAESFSVPFFHVPVEKGSNESAMAQMLELLKNNDLLVLARYMQVLPPSIVRAFPNRIINIHHSFLPSFVGASPYKQAYERGVKIIGATAHYVTEAIDAGPIIEQDTVRVSHKLDVEDMIELGREIERRVLARAVKWHLEDRIIVYKNKTVVFS